MALRRAHQAAQARQGETTGRRFRNSPGARPIVFTTNQTKIRDGITSLAARVGRPEPTVRTVAGLGYYITNWPVCVKVLKPGRKRAGRNRLEADKSKKSGALALALLEARSRINVLDAVQGVGEGKAVRKAWKQGLMQRLT